MKDPDPISASVPRRAFFKFSAGVLGALGALRADVVRAADSTVPSAPPGADDRAAWVRLAGRLASPMLPTLAARRLKATMPVESAPGVNSRGAATHLEALGRLLCGLAPWFELGADATPEGAERARLAALAREGLDAATDPASPDFMNFSRGGQRVVDAAFLAQGLLRAPNELWQKLDPRVQGNVIAALQATRTVEMASHDNNWKLFATTIEVFLQHVGEKRDEARLFDGIRKHEEWYVGDGIYGDGPKFHWDYYNAFVIQPMLYEALEFVGDEAEEWRKQRVWVRERLTRFAAIQERFVAPDGTYPAIGRSLTYRCGAFQGLALAALRHLLSADVTPAQARVALTAVIRRSLEAPGTFDDHGWLRIGVSGAQPALGETYISTGSLYLCSAAFLPLGLPAADPFWHGPPVKTTWQKIWSGENVPADHAIHSPK